MRQTRFVKLTFFAGLLIAGAAAVVLLAGAPWATPQPSVRPLPAIEPLPEGDAGLAAKYPGDRGIEKDPAVIHHDNFEDYTTPEDVHAKYEFVMRPENMRLTEAPADVNSGRKAIEFRLPKQEGGNAAALYREIKDERDVRRFSRVQAAGYGVPQDRYLRGRPVHAPERHPRQHPMVR